MTTIELRDVELHAFHGIYEGESKTGSQYNINLLVSYNEKSIGFDDISATINYVDLFEIIRTRMLAPTGLLEKVCDSIIRHIKHQYPFIVEINISMYKLQAPIKEFQGKVGVSMNRKFNE